MQVHEGGGEREREREREVVCVVEQLRFVLRGLYVSPWPHDRSFDLNLQIG